MGSPRQFWYRIDGSYLPDAAATNPGVNDGLSLSRSIATPTSGDPASSGWGPRLKSLERNDVDVVSGTVSGPRPASAVAAEDTSSRLPTAMLESTKLDLVACGPVWSSTRATVPVAVMFSDDICQNGHHVSPRGNPVTFPLEGLPAMAVGCCMGASNLVERSQPSGSGLCNNGLHQQEGPGCIHVSYHICKSGVSKEVFLSAAVFLACTFTASIADTRACV